MFDDSARTKRTSNKGVSSVHNSYAGPPRVRRQTDDMPPCAIGLRVTTQQILFPYYYKLTSQLCEQKNHRSKQLTVALSFERPRVKARSASDLIAKRQHKVERANSSLGGNNKSAGGPRPPAPRAHIKGPPAIPYKSPNETNPWRNRGDGKR